MFMNLIPVNALIYSSHNNPEKNDYHSHPHELELLNGNFLMYKQRISSSNMADMKFRYVEQYSFLPCNLIFNSVHIDFEILPEA